MSEPLLEIKDLRVQYSSRRRKEPPVQAVNGVSLNLRAGETLGLVGESGSGKSTIGNAILGQVHASAGKITFRGEDITFASSGRRREIGRYIQVIFQDPYSSLNPARTIGKTLAEPLLVGHRVGKRDAIDRVAKVLRHVGMPPDTIHRYPAAFSGGQRQRIAIGRALVLEPQLIVCDEPTSALDLSIQAQILNLLLDLQRELDLSYLLITHDFDVVRHMSHRTAVLFKGRLVEQGPTAQVTERPTDPYTKALIEAVPDVESRPAKAASQDHGDMSTNLAGTIA